jgi:hypothetical protein
MATSLGQDGIPLLREEGYMIMGKAFGGKLKKTLAKRKREGKRKKGESSGGIP